MSDVALTRLFSPTVVLRPSTCERPALKKSLQFGFFKKKKIKQLVFVPEKTLDT